MIEKFLVAATPFPFEDVYHNLLFVNCVADPDEWCAILRTDKIWCVFVVNGARRSVKT